MAYVNTSATPPYLTRALGGLASYTYSFWIKSGTWNVGNNAATYITSGAFTSYTDVAGCEKHGVGGTLYWGIGNLDAGPSADYTAVGTSFTGWTYVCIVVNAGAFIAYTAVENSSPASLVTGSMGVADNVYLHTPFPSPPTAAAKYAAIKFWSVALSPAEVAAEYGSKAPVRTSNLFTYLSGDNGSTIGADQSGNANDWTQVGTGFTTDTDLPSFAPQLSSLSPADGAGAVSGSTTLALTFAENVSVGTGNVKIYQYAAPTSAPTVITRNTDAQQTNATTFVVDTPGTPVAGDLQIIAFSKDDNEEPTGTWPPTGFLVGQSSTAGSTNWAGWIYRFCDGSTDPATVTLTESSENWISRGWLIRGADPLTAPVGGTVATGTSTSANPPNVAFPGDAADPCLVVYYIGIDGNSTFSAHPGGYTNTGSDLTTDATTGNRCGQAYGELASSSSGSDNPGVLTNTSAAWKAFTIAVRGAPTDTLVETISITDGSKVTFSSATVTVDPVATLTGSKLHYVTVDSGAILASDDSSAYLGFSDRTTWNFTTAAAAVTPLRIQQRAKGFPPGAPIPGIARLGYGILALTSPPPVGVTDGTGSAAVAQFAVSASGTVTFIGVGSVASSSFATDATGAQVRAAGPTPMAQPQPMTRQWGMTRLPAPPPIVLGRGILATTSAPAASGFVGSGDATTGAFAASGSGFVTFAATGSAAAAPFGVSGAATEAFAATGAAAMTPMAAAGNAATGAVFTATGSAAMSPFAVTGSGLGAFTGSGTAALPAFAAAAAGSESFAASGSSALAAFAVAATGTSLLAVTGTGAAATAPFAVAGSAATGAVFAGTGSAAMSPVGVTAVGTEAFTGLGSAAVQPFASAAASTLAYVGSGSVALPPAAVAGAGYLGSFIGVGVVSVSPFGVSGVVQMGAIFLPSTDARRIARYVALPRTARYSSLPRTAAWRRGGR